MNSNTLHSNAVASTLRDARRRANFTLRDLASRAATSHATLSAYEQGRKTPSAATFLRILEACGNAVEIRLLPRVCEADGIPRGEELAAVLKLAAQFPAKAARRLDLPVFPHG